MFNLYEILRNAHDGQALERFGFGSLIAALGEGQHLAAFSGPDAAQAAATAQKGGNILSQILTSHSAREEIDLRASSATRISQDMLAKCSLSSLRWSSEALRNPPKLMGLAGSSWRSSTDRGIIAA